MNRNVLIGGGILLLTLVGLGTVLMTTYNEPDKRITAATTPVVPVTVVTQQPSTPVVTVVPPAVRPPLSNNATTGFRTFRCSRASETVIEYGRARNVEFLGQRARRAFWKLDTPSRTVTFNVDVADVNCSYIN
jgi:hypothetical protein